MDIQATDKIEIQQMTSTGSWVTIRTVPYVNLQYVTRQMQFVKRSHPKSAIRAQTTSGVFVNILP